MKLTEHPEYTPHVLLSEVMRITKAKNDLHLARILQISAGKISRIRHHHDGISPEIILRINEVTDLHPRTIRKLMNVPCLIKTEES